MRLEIAMSSLSQFRLLLVFFLSLAFVTPALAFDASTGVAVQGPGSQPNLGFACCEQGDTQMQSTLADPSVLTSLKNLHAAVGLDIEPNFAALCDLRRHRLRLIATLLGRALTSSCSDLALSPFATDQPRLSQRPEVL